MKALKKRLRWQIAVLRGTRPFVYQRDMSLVLRSVRLALYPARTFFQCF